MPAAPTSPFQVAKPERREFLSRHFVSVVEPLIEASGGYAELSVETMIRAAGISRSTFYAYFDDKADLLVAMAADVVADVLDTGESWWTLPDAGGPDELRAALRPPIDAYRRHHTILGAVVEAAAYDARAREQLTRLAGGASKELAAHIRRSQRASSAAPDLDPDRTAKWITWMIERGLYQLVSPASDREAERLLDSLTALVWRVLYAGYR